MTFTAYNPSEVLDRDKVRGKIGDTVQATHQLEDETIEAILVTYPNVTMASIECLRRVKALKRFEFDRSGMGMSSSRSMILQNLDALIKDLQDELVRQGGGIFVGGVSESAQESLEADTNYIQPSFKVGGGDYPGT